MMDFQNRGFGMVLGKVPSILCRQRSNKGNLMSMTTITSKASVQKTISRSAAIIDNTMQRIADLVVIREAWETTDLNRSNEGLYALIVECVLLYREMVSGEDLRAKKQGLNDYMNLRGIQVKSDSPLTLRIIRCIFGSQDRRRISSYHTALRVAIAEKWAPEDVASEIRSRGGIQELSLQRPGAMTAKAKAEAASGAVLNSSIATLRDDRLLHSFDTSHIGDHAVALLTLNSDGSYDVHCVVRSSSAVTATLAAYFSANKQTLEKLRVEAEQAEADTRLDQLVEAAAQAANDAQQGQQA